MSSPRRPTLEDAARAWLDEHESSTSVPRWLVQALTDFVERRYRGAAHDLREVHALRENLLGDQRPLEDLHDAATGPWDKQTLGSAASHSAPPQQGRLLFHLARFHPGTNALELGTNIGISAAYMALGLRYGGGGRVVTVEGSGVRCEEARRVLGQLGIREVEVVHGQFDDVLRGLIESSLPIELAFLDGNHRKEPTMRYFDLLAQAMPSQGLVILDDIRWSEEMLAAWEELRQDRRSSEAVDLGRTGLIVLG